MCEIVFGLMENTDCVAVKVNVKSKSKFDRVMRVNEIIILIFQPYLCSLAHTAILPNKTTVLVCCLIPFMT